MKLLDSFLVALTALRANLLRSMLTTLGIIIGVASVIVLVAVGAGARGEVDKRINALGTHMLAVQSGASRAGGRSAGTGTDVPLAESDVKAILEKVPGVVSASGLLSGSGPVVRGAANWTTTIGGVHAEYTSVRDWAIAAGRDLTPADVRGAAKVALIGQTLARELFPGEDPVGAVIRVKNVPVEIVGLLAPKGQAAMGRDQDDIILLPMTTARGRLVGKSQVQPDQVGQIFVKFDPATDIKEAEEELDQLLRQRRRVPPGAEPNFSVRNMAEFLKARTEVLSTLTYLLAATSVISLVVGGIGIMNIMLVSVTERTREIGLRMAVGARRGDVMLQFLVEAVTLSLLGGVIGVCLGAAGAAATAFIAEWPVMISSNVVVLALGAAACTGIFFGFLPARRAAGLNPIDALRSE